MSDLILRSDRLLLRPIQLEDAGILWPYVSNPEISKDMSWEAHKSIDDTRAFIEGTLKNMKEGRTITWCIYVGNTFCGIFSLISILRSHRSLVYDRAELAYWLGPEFQGKGIMTEAGNLVIAYGFNQLKLNKIVVGHHINNRNSENLIRRLGFKFLYQEDEVFRKNNVWINCKFYELKSKDYLKDYHG